LHPALGQGHKIGVQNSTRKVNFVRADRKNLRSKYRVAFSYNCGVVVIAREAISYEKTA